MRENILNKRAFTVLFLRLCDRSLVCKGSATSTNPATIHKPGVRTLQQFSKFPEIVKRAVAFQSFDIAKLLRHKYT